MMSIWIEIDWKPEVSIWTNKNLKNTILCSFVAVLKDVTNKSIVNKQ
jgi:hypothetical protein